MSESVEKALSYLGEKPKRAAVVIKREVAVRTVTPGHVKLRAPKLPSRAVGRLAERLAVTEGVVLGISDISERTYHRRQSRQELLTEAESDRLLRIARVAAEAERVFGDSAKSRRWLSTDNRLLGAKPLDLLGTDAGSREVEAELGRIDFGDFA